MKEHKLIWKFLIFRLLQKLQRTFEEWQKSSELKSPELWEVLLY